MQFDNALGPCPAITIAVVVREPLVLNLKGSLSGQQRDIVVPDTNNNNTFLEV